MVAYLHTLSCLGQGKKFVIFCQKQVSGVLCTPTTCFTGRAQMARLCHNEGSTADASSSVAKWPVHETPWSFICHFFFSFSFFLAFSFSALAHVSPLLNYHSWQTLPIITTKLPIGVLAPNMLGVLTWQLGELLVALVSAVPIDAVSDEGLGEARGAEAIVRYE